MGTLYKRGKTYYADFVDRHRQRRQVSLRTTDREVAKVRLRDLEFSTTDSGPHTSQALGDALDWFTGTVHAGSPEGTRGSYEQKARHLTRLLGADVKLDALTKDRVLRYTAERLKEGASRHSIHKELVTLRGALKAARERTPPMFHGETAAIVPEWDAKYEPRRTFLSAEQFMKLTEHLVPPLPAKAKQKTIDDAEERRARRTFFCVMIALASPRIGELEKMTWQEHVNRRQNQIRIPKGKTVSRPVAIHPMLREWLEVFGARAGWTGPVLEPWGSCRRDLANACTRAGIPKVTPNDLRRTFASWLVQAGESLFVVATLLGHNSTRMVEKVYGRLDQRTLDNAISKLPGYRPEVSGDDGTRRDRTRENGEETGSSSRSTRDPDCHAGVTLLAQNAVTGGTHGTAPSTCAIVNSVEESRL